MDQGQLNFEDGVQIRQLRPDEVEAAAKFWAEDLGFDICKRLFQRWYDYDPEAFRCITDHHGTIVATASAVKQTEYLYFIGTVGVAESHRGRGLSKRLIRNLIMRDVNANFGLSAVPEYVGLYENLGFQLVDQPYAYIYKGQLPGSLMDVAKPEGVELVQVFHDHPKIDEMQQYDSKVHGYTRDLKKTLMDAEDGVVYVVSKNDRVLGYGKVQTNRTDGGAWFGPLYADSPDLGLYLFSQLLKHYRQQARISIYVILSELAMPWAQELKLNLIEQSPRCYLKPTVLPKMLFSHLYSFDSLDFSLM